MTAKYYAILTNQGAARLASASMLGSKLNLTQMAIGDANGVLPTPDPAQTKLINQKRIAPLNLLSVDPDNQSQIIAEQIIPENEGGFWIREIGLYDDEGVLIAVANCPETYKPQLQEGSGRTQTIRMILVVTNTDSITLKIDPSVVLATRQYVGDIMNTHISARDPHAQYAPKTNPVFTGKPKAPTPEAGNNTTQIATTEFVQQVFAQINPNDFLPIGVPIPYPLATPPDNWMVCNGAVFSANVYPELAKLYPDLKVPDLRGLFIRGWSHGYTPDSGRTLLSRQESAFAEHKHNIYVYAGLQQPLQSSLTSCDPSDTMLVITTNKGVTTADGVDNNSAQYMTGIGKMNCVSEGKKNNLRTAAAIPTAKMSNGENETRPVNMAFNYILRAK
ncbi:phage tail protein [Escherichia coli]|uniref:phage tail protein n=1 Tax=Escherichia coli TaxID=562 RepID=UPI00174D1EFC|nr:phage tail protein [Escherichia coli]QOE50553.1 phage tail protein [Escherichia coli]